MDSGVLYALKRELSIHCVTSLSISFLSKATIAYALCVYNELWREEGAQLLQYRTLL